MVSQANKNGRVLWMMLVAIALLIAITVFVNRDKQLKPQAYVIPSDLTIDGTLLRQARVIHPFHLTGGNGKAFTKTSLKDHWTMMFFGFTNCGYVCPTTLSSLARMYDQFRKDLPAVDIPQVVMVSVDPERDTSARVRSYVKSFSPYFVGARAELPQLKKLSNQMNVVFTKLKSTDGNPKHYMINHSAELMLLDPNGNLRAYFSFPHKATQMVHDYESIIHSIGKTDEV